MLNRGFYLRSQVTPFVILFIERDGSTYMVSMLSEHPQINIVYERFAVLREQNKTAVDQLAWANQFFTPPLVGRDKAVGFKTKLKDVLDLPAFTHLLQQKQVHIIHMQRRNVIKAVVSKINAKRLHDKTGAWNLYKESDRLSTAVLDPSEFDTLVQERVGLDAELSDYVATLNLPILPVCYEDLLLNRAQIMGQIFDFLGVKPFAVQGKTKKNTQDDLRQVIQNYDDLRAQYAGTRYESMFDEVLTA